VEVIFGDEVIHFFELSGLTGVTSNEDSVAEGVFDLIVVLCKLIRFY
jgi:hypothetical protein